MSDPKDKDPAKASDPADSPSSPAKDKRSGRVGYDERGNSVWEWQLETGVYSRDVSTQKLEKLELGDLSIAETAVNERPPVLGGKSLDGRDSGARKSLPGGGFDPYDNARSKAKNLQSKSVGAATPASSKPAAARTPADMKKLDDWVKMKKRLQDAKDDD